MIRPRASPRFRQVAAFCGLLTGPVLFGAWIAAALAQRAPYSFVEHPNSDLGALTADHAWVANVLGGNVPGVLLLAFALALGGSLGRHLSARLGAGLVGAVGALMFASGFLRLDCRQVDLGCENTSWHAGLHGLNSGLTFLAVILAPLVLARALTFAPAWRSLRLVTLLALPATLVGLVGGSIFGEGLGQALGIGVWFLWIGVLAVRLLRLAAAEEAPPAALATSRAPG